MIEQDLSMLEDAQPDGFSFPDAEDCVVKLAKFHARSWGTQRKIIGWQMAAYWTEQKECKKEGIAKAWKKVVKNFPELDLETNLGKRIEKKYAWIKTEIKRAMKQRTICHGDYKISNIFLEHAKHDPITSAIVQGPLVYAIDWQWFGFGNCCIDVVPFIAASLKEDVLSKSKEILRAYHTALVLHGIKNYDWNMFYQDYKIFLLEFVVFCIVGKWSKMTKKDFLSYEKSKKDGLHLRRSSHVIFIVSQVDNILKSWKKTK